MRAPGSAHGDRSLDPPVPLRPAQPAARPRVWRRRIFWLSAVVLLALAYFVMAPNVPNLPKTPAQSEPTGRTAY